MKIFEFITFYRPKHRLRQGQPDNGEVSQYEHLESQSSQEESGPKRTLVNNFVESTTATTEPGRIVVMAPSVDVPLERKLQKQSSIDSVDSGQNGGHHGRHLEADAVSHCSTCNNSMLDGWYSVNEVIQQSVDDVEEDELVDPPSADGQEMQEEPSVVPNQEEQTIEEIV